MFALPSQFFAHPRQAQDGDSPGKFITWASYQPSLSYSIRTQSPTREGNPASSSSSSSSESSSSLSDAFLFFFGEKRTFFFEPFSWPFDVFRCREVFFVWGEKKLLIEPFLPAFESFCFAPLDEDDAPDEPAEELPFCSRFVVFFGFCFFLGDSKAISLLSASSSRESCTATFRFNSRWKNFLKYPACLSV